MHEANSLQMSLGRRCSYRGERRCYSVRGVVSASSQLVPSEVLRNRLRTVAVHWCQVTAGMVRSL